MDSGQFECADSGKNREKQPAHREVGENHECLEGVFFDDYEEKNGMGQGVPPCIHTHSIELAEIYNLSIDCWGYSRTEKVFLT